MSTFSLTYPVGPRAAVAKAVRAGDHHAKGQHTELDKMREGIAEYTENGGAHDEPVELTVEHEHYEDWSHFSVTLRAADEEDIDPDAYAAPPEQRPLTEKEKAWAEQIDMTGVKELLDADTAAALTETA